MIVSTFDPVFFFIGAVTLGLAVVVVKLRRFGQDAKCVCRITQDCSGRIRSERIQMATVDFLCQLAEAKGFGLGGDRKINYRGSDIVARFNATGKIDKDAGLPIVEMWTIYHDKTTYNEDGSFKGKGDSRTYRLRSRDHQDD